MTERKVFEKLLGHIKRDIRRMDQASRNDSGS